MANQAETGGGRGKTSEGTELSASSTSGRFAEEIAVRYVYHHPLVRKQLKFKQADSVLVETAILLVCLDTTPCYLSGKKTFSTKIKFQDLRNMSIENNVSQLQIQTENMMKTVEWETGS